MTGLVEGKVALVTGAGSGIGRASALAFAREGARVAVSDRDKASGKETVDLVTAAGGTAIFLVCDVADEDQVEALVDGTVAELGGLDCAHDNAGLGGGRAKLADISRERWDLVHGVNLTGTFLCLQHQIRYMREHGGGAIVVTSSATSLLGFPLTSAYAATKAALNQLVRSAAVEHAPDRIRVNAVLPGPIRTQMVTSAVEADPDLEQHLAQSVPTGRIGEPDEVAQAAVWLCSDRSSFITGTALPVDGGQVLL